MTKREARVQDVAADVVVVDMATRESLELIGDLRREAHANAIGPSLDDAIRRLEGGAD